MNFFSTLIIIFLLTLSLTYYLLKSKYDDFIAQSKMQELQSIEYQKQLLQSEVERSISYINYKKMLVQKRLGGDLKEKVDEVVSLAGTIYKKNIKSKNLNEIKNLVKEAIRPMRFNKGEGYFFAASLDGYEQLYPPHPELENKCILGLQDSRGSYAILDEIKMVKEHGSGFVKHYWSKPNSSESESFLKISYIKLFKPFNWYFGTGKYINDVETEMQDEALDYFHNIKFGKKNDDCLLILEVPDLNKTPLFGKIKYLPIQTDMVNGNLSDTVKDYYGKEYRKELINQLKIHGQGFAKFYTKSPADQNLKTKIIYLKHYKEWNWVVGAILDVSDLYQSLDQAKADVQHKLIRELIYILLITIVFFVLAAIFSWYVSRLMQREFDIFIDFFNHAAIDNRMLSIGSLDIKEFKSLAEALNLMILKRDVTEKRLKENENTFRGFMDHADEFMIIKDLENRYVMVNKKLKEVMNLEYRDIIGKKPEDLGYLADEVQAMKASEQAVIESEQSIIQEKPAIKSKTIGVEWVEEIVFPIFGSDDRVKYVGILSRNITERKKAEDNIACQQEQLKSAYQELKQSQEIVIRQEKLASLGTMIAGIAHEINNPAQAIEFSLTGLKMNTNDLEEIVVVLRSLFNLSDQEKLKTLNNLKKLFEDKQVDEIFKEISSVVNDNKQAVNRISNIVQSIKRLVHNNIEFSDCNIKEIINDSVNLVKNQLKNNITIITELADDTPLFTGSAQEIGQVFINMLINANDAVTEKKLKKVDAYVKITTAYLQDSKMIRVVVKDNGCGVKEEIIEKIFDPFLTTKPVGKGTGLGLYISYQIIENHNGKINVVSRLGEGTEFTILLPEKSILDE